MVRPFRRSDREQDGAVVAAALLSRYRDDADVGDGFRGAGEVKWLLFRPEAPSGDPYWGDGWAAAQALLEAALARFDEWRVRRAYADGTLPLAAVHGVPDQWPHVADLYARNGFAPPQDHVEILHLARLAELAPSGPAMPGVTLPGMTVRRSVGINGIRFTAVRDGVDLGQTAAIGFVERNGFTEVTRTRRGWERPVRAGVS